MQGWEERYLAFWAKKEEGKKRKRKGAKGKARAQHVEANKEEKGKARLCKERRRRLGT